MTESHFLDSHVWSGQEPPQQPEEPLERDLGDEGEFKSDFDDPSGASSWHAHACVMMQFLSQRTACMDAVEGCSQQPGICSICSLAASRCGNLNS